MRSTPVEDRTSVARVRDAAIECFGENGVDGTSVRTVAQRAGVSPGLVIHHFGSKDGLRTACDDHVAAVVQERRSRRMREGPSLDVLAAVREGTDPAVLRYLLMSLADGSAAATRLVTELAGDAADSMREGIATGALAPVEDVDDVAAVLTLWSLGALVLHRQVAALLDVDLLDGEVARDPQRLRRYARAAATALGAILSAESRDHLRTAFGGDDA